RGYVLRRRSPPDRASLAAPLPKNRAEPHPIHALRAVRESSLWSPILALTAPYQWGCCNTNIAAGKRKSFPPATTMAVLGPDHHVFAAYGRGQSWTMCRACKYKKGGLPTPL